MLVNAVAPGPVEDELWTEPGGLADQIAARQGTDRDEVLEATRSKLPRGPHGHVGGDRRRDRVPVLGAGVERERSELVGRRRLDPG